jgi:hypothetical protein
MTRALEVEFGAITADNVEQVRVSTSYVVGSRVRVESGIVFTCAFGASLLTPCPDLSPLLRDSTQLTLLYLAPQSEYSFLPGIIQ